MQQIIPFSLIDQGTKSNFIGTGNTHIIYQLDKVLAMQNANIFIYGSTYGKTHLLQAYTLLALEQDLRVLYLNLKTSSPLLDNLTELELDILFLDNLEYASSGMQRILFDAYNTTTCIVFTANNDNNTLDLLKDLNTRINKSIKLKINDLSDDDKLIILLEYAHKNTLNIKEKHIKYLFTNYSRDLKKLIKTLELLGKESLAQHAKISSQFIKKILF